MKNIIILLLLAISVLQAISQTERPLTKDDYLRKSKNQKKTAWIMLVGGTVVTSIGVAVGLSGTVDQAYGTPTSNKNETLASILVISGSAALLGSIPFFIAANRNKKRAMSLSASGQQAPWIVKNNLTYKTVPSITLKIGL